MLEIRLLGQFNLLLDGNPVDIPSRPAQSLLAFLALTAGVAHRREKLAGMLWPDVPEGDARRNLHRALWHIRKALEGRAPLQVDDITVAFIAGSDIWVDVLALSKKAAGEWTLAELTNTVSAYGGELLPGFYDEWVIVEREQLQDLFSKAASSSCSTAWLMPNAGRRSSSGVSAGSRWPGLLRLLTGR